MDLPALSRAESYHGGELSAFSAQLSALSIQQSAFSFQLSTLRPADFARLSSFPGAQPRRICSYAARGSRFLAALGISRWTGVSSRRGRGHPLIAHSTAEPAGWSADHLGRYGVSRRTAARSCAPRDSRGRLSPRDLLGTTGFAIPDCSGWEALTSGAVYQMKRFG